MSDENVVPINRGQLADAEEIQADPTHREKLIAFLRELADDLEMAPESIRTAVAFFVDDGDGIDVRCGGFADDQASIRYLSAFIRNQGFAS